MAQTLLRKRPYAHVRSRVEEAYEEPQSRQRIDLEGASSIRFKSTRNEMERVQSICDNIVDLLTNLALIDDSCPTGLSHEDRIQVRSFKNELESYIRKYRESELEFDLEVQRAEIDTFCEKSTALIECLLPSLPTEIIDKQEIGDEGHKQHDELLSEASAVKVYKKDKKTLAFTVLPRESPL